jgi:hypothetical protein
MKRAPKLALSVVKTSERRLGMMHGKLCTFINNLLVLEEVSLSTNARKFHDMTIVKVVNVTR